MNDALIGHTGFVGQTLNKQHQFQSFFRSTTISEIADQSFDKIVCAGAPAQKWKANKAPAADLDSIDLLISNLQKVQCKQFILISTVDVFKDPRGVDESSIIDEADLQPYGKNRRKLEKFVEAHFERFLIVRLPGLVGPGLKKNVIYDLLHNNNLLSIDSRSIFQFYPMVNLWSDIRIAIEANLKLVHLTSEPISVRDVAESGFGRSFSNHIASEPAEYDFRSQHAEIFGVDGNYQYGKRDALTAIRAYAQSELHSSHFSGGRS